MLKSLKLKPFVDVEIIDNVLNIKKVTPLFTKLVENVKNEYRTPGQTQTLLYLARSHFDRRRGPYSGQCVRHCVAGQRRDAPD